MEGRPAQSVGAGSRCEVLLDSTPFYAESGGQVRGEAGQVGPASRAHGSGVRLRSWPSLVLVAVVVACAWEGEGMGVSEALLECAWGLGQGGLAGKKTGQGREVDHLQCSLLSAQPRAPTLQAAIRFGPPCALPPTRPLLPQHPTHPPCNRPTNPPTQIGDHGLLRSSGGAELAVRDCQKAAGGAVSVHVCEVVSGQLSVGDEVGGCTSRRTRVRAWGGGLAPGGGVSRWVAGGVVGQIPQARGNDVSAHEPTQISTVDRPPLDPLHRSTSLTDRKSVV